MDSEVRSTLTALLGPPVISAHCCFESSLQSFLPRMNDTKYKHDTSFKIDFVLLLLFLQKYVMWNWSRMLA